MFGIGNIFRSNHQIPSASKSSKPQTVNNAKTPAQNPQKSNNNKVINRGITKFKEDYVYSQLGEASDEFAKQADADRFIAREYLKGTPDGALKSIEFFPGHRMNIELEGKSLFDVLDLKPDGKVYTKSGYVYCGAFKDDTSYSRFDMGKLITRTEDGKDGHSIDTTTYRDGKIIAQKHIDFSF